MHSLPFLLQANQTNFSAICITQMDRLAQFSFCTSKEN